MLSNCGSASNAFSLAISVSSLWWEVTTTCPCLDLMLWKGRLLMSLSLCCKRISLTLRFSLKILWKEKECPLLQWHGQYFESFKSLVAKRDSTSGNWRISSLIHCFNKAAASFLTVGKWWMNESFWLHSYSRSCSYSWLYLFCFLIGAFGSLTFFYSHHQRSPLRHHSDCAIGSSNRFY